MPHISWVFLLPMVGLVVLVKWERLIHLYAASKIAKFTETWGFSGGAGGKEPACQCRRCKRGSFDLWVRKIPWRREWQPIPLFLPRESPWTAEPGMLQSIGSQRVGHK